MWWPSVFERSEATAKHSCFPCSVPTVLLRHHKGKTRNFPVHHRKTSKHRVSLTRRSSAVVLHTCLCATATTAGTPQAQRMEQLSPAAPRDPSWSLTHTGCHKAALTIPSWESQKLQLVCFQSLFFSSSFFWTGLWTERKSNPLAGTFPSTAWVCQTPVHLSPRLSQHH